MGTPELAAVQLRALLAGPHQVVAVVCRPDRRAGRGKRLVSPPVAALARAEGLPLLQPTSVKRASFRRWLREHRPDIGVVAAFGHILGPKVLATPPLGCVNVHASLLPRWRGASPIQMAIAAGDARSGVSIMQLDTGMDTGDVLHVASCPIGPEDTADVLHDRLAAIGAEALHVALAALEAGTATATPQPDEGVTFAPILNKADGRLDWREPAAALERRVRAFHPWPGTSTSLDGKILKVLPPIGVADQVGEAAPGHVVAASRHGIDVACGDGRALRLLRVQAAGKRAVDAAAFLAGRDLRPGMTLGAGASSQA